MVTMHNRATWATQEPVTGPALQWSRIDTVAAHYTAAPNLIDGDPGEFQHQIPARLRATHKDYLYNRPSYNSAGVKTSTGYSIGYNWMVDWLGGIWELRGWGIKCAANQTYKGVDWNARTIAILCYVDGADPMTDEAAESFRWLAAEAERRAGRELAIKGHQEIGATACPGAGIMAQIRAGKLSPRYVKPTPEPEQPPTEDDDMTTAYIWRDARFKNSWLCGVGAADHLTPASRDTLVGQRGIVEIVEVHDLKLKQCLTQSGLDLADLVPV